MKKTVSVKRKTMEKAMTILEMVAASDAPQGVLQISRALVLPLATAHRHLQHLVTAELLVQDAATSRYTLGERAFRIAQAISQQRGPARGRQVLLEVNERTTFSTLVGKLVGERFVYTENIPSTGSMSVRGEIGSSGPLHATSIGKAILSTLSDAGYTALLSSYSLEAYTSETITARARLDDEVALVRERGYAEANAEFEQQVASISVPFRVDNAGRTGTYAICIAAHVSEMDALRSWIDEVRHAADRLKGLM
ncbi:IclR family transcriptional regulator [Cryobacterium sp. Hh7]|uniref:IclR family transcriptional regulator n=1 Tax=Cryobacterium sp. Hh7 TaxID=1259159 RepID=UPI00141BDDAF|nr:IclR family transcriptional regulator [Cryobacterium sp. Hh7]